MKHIESQHGEEFVAHEVASVPDIAEPEVYRRLIREQDPKILEAAETIAARVSHLSPDAAHPEVSPRAMIVGGFVRDALWGLKPKDADLEVYGVQSATLQRFLAEHWPTQSKKMGRAFAIHKIHLAPGVELDISIPRRESQPGVRSSDIEVEGDPTLTVEEAALRRDFRFNSLAFDPLTHELFDPFGGVQDIKDRIMRVTNVEKFQEDPIRIYRALQFVGRLQPQVEANTFRLLKDMVDQGRIEDADVSRVTAEMRKLFLKSESPSHGLEFALDLGIVEKYMPELFALRGCEQEKEWHPEGDVWIHTMMVVDAAVKIIRRDAAHLTEDEQLQIVLGALCHDLGKPLTTRILDGRWRSIGHDVAGIEPTERFLSRYNFGESIVNAAKVIAAQHLMPDMHFRSLTTGQIDEKQYNNIVRKLIKRIRPVSWRVLLAGSEADSRGRSLPGVATGPYRAGEKFQQAILENNLEKEAAAPLVGGKDIMRISAELEKTVKPGPIFTELVSRVESLRDEGKIMTREEGLEVLKTLIEKL